MAEQKFVHTFNKTEVRLRIQIKPIRCHELSNVCAVNKQRMVEEGEKDKRLALHEKCLQVLLALDQFRTVQLVKLRVPNLFEFPL